MKILGCFKIVPDLDLVAEEDWAADDQLQIDTSYVKQMWNCFDESAMEMMLKLSDLSEGFDVVYELNALTVGKQRHETFLKTLYALGYDHSVRIAVDEEDEGQDITFCPEMIARSVADYIDNCASQDVVIMGIQSSDGSNMKTPLLLAEKLGWPCITQVIGIEPVDEGHLKVKSQEEAGTRIQVVKVPCVLAVGNAPCSYLRVPTLKDKMRLGKRPVECIPFECSQKNCQDGDMELIALNPVENKRDTVIITGETPEEKAQKLYDSYLKERLKAL